MNRMETNLSRVANCLIGERYSRMEDRAISRIEIKKKKKKWNENRFLLDYSATLIRYFDGRIKARNVRSYKETCFVSNDQTSYNFSNTITFKPHISPFYT